MLKTCGTSTKPRQLRERYCALVDANVVQRRAVHGTGEDFICYNKPACSHGRECGARAPEAVSGTGAAG